ncbi:WD-repeat region-domain-containing protein [Tribonema minus]|uniref:WD-repeat region-domain-containing protein n=1 Tax=Tribonema minus TaxID=303371 RepID=A0A835YLD4_9STRA|nr:WD-repeat region-domain-containing protein [Tribonema minus]
MFRDDGGPTAAVRGSALLPCNATCTEYCGFIEALGRQFRIKIRLKSPGGQVDAEAFACDAELSQILTSAGALPALRLRLAQTPDPASFVAELQDVLQRLLRAAPQSAPAPAAYYSRLVAEIDKVGWEHLVTISERLSHLQLRVSDAAGRHHVIGVTMPPDYPRTAPTCVADLPAPFALQWRAGQSSLADVLGQFRAALAPFLPLWEVLDDLDAHTHVLEPEHRSRAIAQRRVALAPHCSLSLALNPLAPRAAPEVRFLGAQASLAPFKAAVRCALWAQASLAPFKAAFAANAPRTWDPSRLLRANLEAALGAPLPSPATTLREDISGDCGICYQYRLADASGGGGSGGSSGAVPDRVCDNARCRRPYHPACLLAWLQGLPESRTSFGTTFGTCPYCSEDISATS